MLQSLPYNTGCLVQYAHKGKRPEMKIVLCSLEGVVWTKDKCVALSGRKKQTIN